MTTALAKRPADLILGDKREAIMAALPSMVSKERFIQIAAAICNSHDIAECSPVSVLTCIFGCAKLGLIPDPVLGHVYLIPYKGVATLMPGYKGYLELARRSGKLAAVNSAVVCANDDFDYWTDERGRHLMHRTWDRLGRPDAGAPTDVYCVASVDGEPQVEVMRWAEVQGIKTDSAQWKSKGAKSVWGQHEYEMARKTAIRRAAKSWPLSPELAQATAWDEEGERGERQSIPVVNGDVRDKLTLDSFSEGTDAAPSTATPNGNPMSAKEQEAIQREERELAVQGRD